MTINNTPNIICMGTDRHSWSHIFSPYSGINSHSFGCSYFLCKFWKNLNLLFFSVHRITTWMDYKPLPSFEHIVCEGQYLARGSTFSQHKLNIESPDWHNLAWILSPPKGPQRNLSQLLQFGPSHIDTVLHCTAQNLCWKTTWPGNGNLATAMVTIWHKLAQFNSIWNLPHYWAQYGLVWHILEAAYLNSIRKMSPKCDLEKFSRIWLNSALCYIINPFVMMNWFLYLCTKLCSVAPFGWI